MEHLVIPDGYRSPLTIRETEVAIKEVKDHFERALAKALHLTRVSAPLFVRPESGLNDNLNGVERPVAFGIREQDEAQAEIVHSLAKWKRHALKHYGFHSGEGLYTDMSAIRRDEDTDNIHSLYVDQWDWEKVIHQKERTEETLKATVRQIFKVIKHMEHEVWYKYPQAVKRLPEEITFVTSEELLSRYPLLTAKERENAAAKEYGCIFLMHIGDALSDGKPHDGRAPDYDDWHLNGDILFWYDLLDCALEISSMGIRVDEESLTRQCEQAGCPERLKLPFHQMLLNQELPYTIGGGIGQSRLCMLLLNRAHVGEVQASEWPDEMRMLCEENQIHLL